MCATLVDYLKLDGCNNDKASYATGKRVSNAKKAYAPDCNLSSPFESLHSGYPAMGTALQNSGRNISYSCSWPAYLGGNESAKPFDAMIAAGCNSWRNWDDISNNWNSISSIIDHWGDYSKALQASAGPGHW